MFVVLLYGLRKILSNFLFDFCGGGGAEAQAVSQEGNCLRLSPSPTTEIQTIFLLFIASVAFLSYDIEKTNIYVFYPIFFLKSTYFLEVHVMDNYSSHRKNPSRQTCETIIKRILITEVLEKGTNQHFKQASDFMNYFESLYPASDSLVKQVQRAVKAMDMPKDANGYFIINKSHEQLRQEEDLRYLFSKGNVSLSSLDHYETLFLKADRRMHAYLMDLIAQSVTFQNKYFTMIRCYDGILFFTENKSVLSTLLESLLTDQ